MMYVSPCSYNHVVLFIFGKLKKWTAYSTDKMQSAEICEKESSRINFHLFAIFHIAEIRRVFVNGIWSISLRNISI